MCSVNAVSQTNTDEWPSQLHHGPTWKFNHKWRKHIEYFRHKEKVPNPKKRDVALLNRCISFTFRECYGIILGWTCQYMVVSFGFIHLQLQQKRVLILNISYINYIYVNMCKFMQNLIWPLDAKCVCTGMSANRWRSCDIFFMLTKTAHFNTRIWPCYYQIRVWPDQYLDQYHINDT